MIWNKLESIADLEDAIKKSHDSNILLFKHSTRCSISTTALSRLERSWQENGTIPYFLDLLNHRDISAAIETTLGVQHQSPQAIVVKDGKSIYDASHMMINAKQILSIG